MQGTAYPPYFDILNAIENLVVMFLASVASRPFVVVFSHKLKQQQYQNKIREKKKMSETLSSFLNCLFTKLGKIYVIFELA